MSIACCAPGCRSRSDKWELFIVPHVPKSIGLERKLRTENQRNRWLKILHLQDAPKRCTKICSKHFKQGRPADIYSYGDRDWAPTRFIGKLIPEEKERKELWQDDEDEDSGTDQIVMEEEEIESEEEREVVITCSMPSCRSRSDNADKKFHDIPEVPTDADDETKTAIGNQRSTWLKILQLPDPPPPCTKICSRHFKDGDPTDARDTKVRDWAPTLFVGEMLPEEIDRKKLWKVKAKSTSAISDQDKVGNGIAKNAKNKPKCAKQEGVKCCVQTCSSRCGPFYSLPFVPKNIGLERRLRTQYQRDIWLLILDLTEAPHRGTKICSRHFKTGKPSDAYDREDRDWAPTLHVGKLIREEKKRKRLWKVKETTEPDPVLRASSQDQDNSLCTLRTIEKKQLNGKVALKRDKKVVTSCWVPGCSSRSDDGNEWTFYSFPWHYKEGEDKQLIAERRCKWLSNIARPMALWHSKICSRHFVSGKPAEFDEKQNPDWAPTLHLHHSSGSEPTKPRSTNKGMESEQAPSSKDKKCTHIRSKKLRTSLAKTNFCWVPGCYGHSNLKEAPEFFEIPQIARRDDAQTRILKDERRRAWLSAINFWKVPQDATICSKHFKKGEPSPPGQRSSPDWVPSMWIGKYAVGKEKTTESSQPAESECTMIGTCSVPACQSKQDTEENWRFYSVPQVNTMGDEQTTELSTKRRHIWLVKINSRLQPHRIKICSKHFVSGRPAVLHDLDHPDWSPCRHLSHRSCKRPTSGDESYRPSKMPSRTSQSAVDTDSDLSKDQSLDFSEGQSSYLSKGRSSDLSRGPSFVSADADFTFSTEATDLLSSVAYQTMLPHLHQRMADNEMAPLVISQMLYSHMNSLNRMMKPASMPFPTGLFVNATDNPPNMISQDLDTISVKTPVSESEVSDLTLPIGTIIIKPDPSFSETESCSPQLPPSLGISQAPPPPLSPGISQLSHLGCASQIPETATIPCDEVSHSATSLKNGVSLSATSPNDGISQSSYEVALSSDEDSSRSSCEVIDVMDDDTSQRLSDGEVPVNYFSAEVNYAENMRC